MWDALDVKFKGWLCRQEHASLTRTQRARESQKSESNIKFKLQSKELAVKGATGSPSHPPY